MKNLVLKDMRLLGIFNLLLFAIPLALGYISTLPDKNFHALAIYIFAALVPIYLLVVRMSVNDMTSNANPLLISLPVKRFDIVRSRYISVFIYTLLISLTVFLSSNISRILFGSKNGSVFNLTSMLFTASLILVFLSINIPFQYYDARKTQISNSLFYAFLILAPNLLGKFNIDLSNNNVIQKILSLNFKLLAPGLLLISLIIYVSSLFISKSIYIRKEF